MSPVSEGMNGVRAMAGRVYDRAKAWERPVTRRVARARRDAFVARLRAQAVWHGCDLDLDVADDVRLGRDVRVVLQPRTRNVLRIAPGCTLGDRVLVLLKGGSVELGPRCDVRRDVVLNVSGRLELRADNILSWGDSVHCSEAVVLERYAAASERVTIADSSHFHTGPDDFFYHNVKTGPVTIGANTWLCTGAVITRGARVGAQCVVAANSVVSGAVPDAHLASGVPATTQPLPHALREAVAR